MLGSDYKALGIVRSLGRRNIPCFVIDSAPRSAWFSRYVEKRFRWHGHMDNEDFLNFLLRLAKEHQLEQWILLPLPDEAVELVSRHTDLLACCYRLATQEWNIVRWANDKRMTYSMANEIGIPYPKTWYPAYEDDLQAMDITFPVIIKPITSAPLQYALHLKALPATRREELLSQYRFASTIIAPEQLMVQEIIPGDGMTQYSVAAYCKDGSVLVSMTARRTRQYPIDYGLGSSFVEAIQVPALLELAEKLLGKMRVSGMVEVEFKYDRRDNRYKLLDVNLRPWGWHTLCIACGLDFPFIQYCDLLGQVLEMKAPSYDYRWIRLLTDIPAAIDEIKAGITTPGAYLRSLAGKTVYSIFDWRDPLPAVGDLAGASIRYAKVRKEQKRYLENLIAPAPFTQATTCKKQGAGAVVIGGDFQGLGIVRSLGRRGIPVCIIDDEKSISRFSRYATHAVHATNLRDERRTIDTLIDTGHRLGLEGWVLFPTRDETVAAISRYRSELAEWFRVPTPDLSVVEWAWDKRNTYRLAKDLDIPIPRTWYPQDISQLEEIEAEPPLVVKPAIKEHFIYATKAKAWKANSREELKERFLQASALVEAGEIMIQEMIPGDGREQFSYCAFFKEGKAVGSMVAQRKRQHPPDFGRASTFVETIDLPELEDYSLRFLQAIDYYGLVELEYKRDPRDGQFKLLDVNARTWGYHSLGQRAGVDFPYLLFADQLGEDVAPQRAQVGIKWIRLATDLPTGVVEIFHKHLDWQSYLRSLKGIHTESVFSTEDPLPGLVELALLPYLFLKRGF